MIQFGTNDVKYHLLTLMVFDLHHTRVPITWVITSWQTCEDLVEWLIPLQAKLMANMPD
jgi:phosphatidylserine decarboxylase